MVILRHYALTIDYFQLNVSIPATYGDISSVFGMVWRFAPMADGTVAEFHSRDLDSRISEREIAAVKDWDRTNKSFHIMRDNPYHVSHIMGIE